MLDDSLSNKAAMAALAQVFIVAYFVSCMPKAANEHAGRGRGDGGEAPRQGNMSDERAMAWRTLQAR